VLANEATVIVKICIGFSSATTVLLGYERPFRSRVFRRRKASERSPSIGRRGKP
jgi:hypothetical protein